VVDDLTEATRQRRYNSGAILSLNLLKWTGLLFFCHLLICQDRNTPETPTLASLENI